MEPVAASLRPRDLGEILDAAIEQYRAHLPLVQGISLAGTGALAASLLLLVHGSTALGWSPFERPAAAVGLALLVGALFAWRFVGQGALAFAAYRSLEGEPPSVAEAYRHALSRGLSLALAGCGYSIATATFAVVYLLPAAIPMGFLSLAGVVAALEEPRLFGAFRRSATLLSGFFGRALALRALLALFSALLFVNLFAAVKGGLALARFLLGVETAYLQAATGFANGPYILALLLATFVLADPLKTLALVHLYLDKRVRLEGFDLRRKVARLAGADLALRASSGT